MRIFLAIFVALSVFSGCAIPGRYLQMRAEDTGNLVAQFNVQSGSLCQAELSVAKRMQSSAGAVFQCTDNTLSGFLPVRATLRDKPLGTLIEAEFLDWPACRATVDSMLKTMDLVFDCRAK